MNPDGTNIKKLEDQSVSYINVDDHYIYYCKLKGKSADSFSFLRSIPTAYAGWTLTEKENLKF